MKNSKILKTLILVLSLTLLIGAASVIGISAESSDTATEDMILAQNVIYGEKIIVVYAVNATIEEAQNDKVTVNYYWDNDTEDVKTAKLLDPTVVVDGVKVNVYTNKNGVEYPLFYTEGVAAKELGKVAHVTTDGGTTYKTYSAAEYFYSRLYKDDFINKTEADGKDYNRSQLYQNVLEYGANAQVIFDYNTDKLATEYNYAYTTNKNVKLNGKSSLLDVDTVTATYDGEGTVEAWVVNGVEVDSNVITVSGVTSIDVKLGVHTCIDENPADHKCDTCSETISECKNENADHLCDVCGAVVDACADSNSDGKCDVCAKYIFDVTTMSSGNGVSFVNIAANSGTDYTTASGTVTLDGGRPDGYTKGTWLYLETDPTNAANTVLASNSVSASSMTDDAISDVIFTPDVQVEGGDLIVLEYDYYVDGCGNDKNSMKFVYNYADGTTSRANATYVTSAGIRLIADTDGSMRWSLDTWVRVRLVCDNTNNKIYTYLSTDSGVTYTLCEKVNDATATVSSVGFTYIGYGVASTQYYDNIVCVQTNAATYGITLE